MCTGPIRKLPASPSFPTRAEGTKPPSSCTWNCGFWSFNITVIWARAVFDSSCPTNCAGLFPFGPVDVLRAALASELFSQGSYLSGCRRNFRNQDLASEHRLVSSSPWDSSLCPSSLCALWGQDWGEGWLEKLNGRNPHVGTDLYIDCSGGHTNLHVQWNCTETHRHTHLQQAKPTAAPVCSQTPGDLVKLLNKLTERCSIQKNSKYRKGNLQEAGSTSEVQVRCAISI